MKRFIGFEKGMGIGGWLTNYKRFHVIPKEKINWLTIGDEEHFQDYITENDVINIKNMGFDHIRVCFDQVVFQAEDGFYRYDHIALLDAFIGWCKKHQMNVVINLHKALGSYCDVDTGEDLLDSESLQDRLVAFWIELEQHYANQPQVVFELLNEVKDVDPEKWNVLATRLIDGIRKLNKTRKIILGTTNWNSPDNLKDIKVFDDENVIYTFHFYEPFEFTHQQGVLQTRTELYNRKMPYPGDIDRYRDYQRFTYGTDAVYDGLTEMNGEFVQRALAPVKEFIKNNPDKIVWCGEFGNIRHAKMEWRIAWFKDVIGFLKENEIPYSVWNYLSTPNDGNRFSLTDDETREMLSEELHKVLLGQFE
jgi:hypothetical protein